MLTGQGDHLALKLQLQDPLADLAHFCLQSRIGQRVSQPLLELFLLERDGLVFIDLIEVNCDFGDPVHADAAIVGIHNQQPAVIVELAAEWQPIGVVLIGCDFDVMREQ